MKNYLDYIDASIWNQNLIEKRAIVFHNRIAPQQNINIIIKNMAITNKSSMLYV